MAAFLVAAAAAGVAHLVGLGVEQGRRSGRYTTARLLAQSKLEELRARQWTYGAGAVPLSALELTLSPASLAADVPGFVDLLDRFGAPAANAASAEFRRRWAVSLMAPHDVHTIAIAVCVFPALAAPAAPLSCVWTARTRQP